MACLTAEQRDTAREQERLYGPSSFKRLEWTLKEAYGVLWMHWYATADHPVERNLFIKPDGSRLSWKTLY